MAIADLLARDAIALASDSSRAILGIAGSPGAGKSTLVDALVARIQGGRSATTGSAPRSDGWLPPGRTPARPDRCPRPQGRPWRHSTRPVTPLHLSRTGEGRGRAPAVCAELDPHTVENKRPLATTRPSLPSAHFRRHRERRSTCSSAIRDWAGPAAPWTPRVVRRKREASRIERLLAPARLQFGKTPGEDSRRQVATTDQRNSNWWRPAAEADRVIVNGDFLATWPYGFGALTAT